MTLTLLDDRLDHAPCGFLSFTDDGIVTTVNRTLLEMLGYGRDEVIGRHVERLLTIGSRIFYQTHWFPLLRLHGRAEEIFMMLRARTGEDVGVLVNAVRRERGGVVEHDCVVLRVRERQKYEDELLRAKRSAEGARTQLEAQKRELQRANEHLQAQARELEQQQLLLHDQTVELEAAGEELQAINEDLRARREEAEQLRVLADEANQAKSAFLAVMSHELRTPLNAIAGYVQILEMGIHGPITEAQRDALERIDRSQRHLLRLVNDVLNLARIEAGRIDYTLEPVAVGTLVAAVLPMVEPQFERKGVGFAVELAPDLAARADREKVKQILLNVLGNAVKFTPSGGHVRLEGVRLAQPSGIVALRVQDTGIGIPPEKLHAVFEPFVQVDTGPARGEEGSGLGLAISRDLARGMGGDLVAESTPGEGSTFTLTLPVA